MRTVEVRLEHGPDCVVALAAQALVRAQRHVDERRLLHVDADERPEPLGPTYEPLDVRVRELLVDVQPQMRELERDVRP